MVAFEGKRALDVFHKDSMIDDEVIERTCPEALALRDFFVPLRVLLCLLDEALVPIP